MSAKQIWIMDGGNMAACRVSPVRRLILAASLQLQLWLGRARQRRTLAGLDDRMLRDIGLTRLQANTEAGKACWR